MIMVEYGELEQTVMCACMCLRVYVFAYVCVCMRVSNNDSE